MHGVSKHKNQMRIIANNTALILSTPTGGQGANITLERHNPLTDGGAIRGTRILDFTLPACNINNRVFAYANVPGVPLSRTKLECQLELDGIEIDRGYLLLKDITPQGSYVVQFTSAFGDLWGQYTATKLNALPLGSVAVPGSPVANPTVGTALMAFPKIANSAFYGTNSYSGYMNNYATGTYGSGPLVPMFFVSKVLELIGTLTGVTFAGDIMTNTAMQRLIFYNTQSLDTLSTITYAKHLPEMTISELIMGLCAHFNMVPWIDARQKLVTINFADSILAQAPVLNLSRQLPELIGRNPSTANRLNLIHTLDTGDALHKTTPATLQEYTAPVNPELVEGPNSLYTIKSPFSTLSISGGLPITEQVGISPNYNQGTQKFGPRLLFWEGLTGGLPVASDIYGSHTLRLSQPELVVGPIAPTTYYTNTEAYIANTYAVAVSTQLNAKQLATLDHHRHQGANAVVYAQGQHYLVGAQRIQLPTGGQGGLWQATLHKL